MSLREFKGKTVSWGKRVVRCLDPLLDMSGSLQSGLWLRSSGVDH